MLHGLVTNIPIPEKFNFPFDYIPHPLSLLACKMLQSHLLSQKEWKHNFGLDADDGLPVIGKMFGVLVVMTEEGKLGYLAAFSGKLAGSNHHSFFVPPVYDGLAFDGFLNSGMMEISEYGRRIAALELLGNNSSLKEIDMVRETRRRRSVELQNNLFDQYRFLNQFGIEKSIRDIFYATGHKNPPAGAGECAAPKLLQYAFQHQLKPISMAEFWWGVSPKSAHWKHGQFYPSCQEKCAPILAHMLEGLELEKPLQRSH
ncbi:pseudouridylate synthase [Dyadobacter luteus]|uniref:Pseudouridylate synthase n=1 Tax=Dyadobacter luteus TaxID=2259619 RepID=A0A3D8Y5A9_9BACT|nr:pseudouridylate synthase [Dyadobacter luteus]